MDTGQLYASTRGRITDLVRELDDDQLDLVVPSCPAWRVRDLVAHIRGVVDDIANGRTEGAATDEWTARQVEARRGVPVGQILDEWESAAPELEPQMSSWGGAGRILVADLVIHEQDLRQAVGRPGGTDSEAYDVVLQGLIAEAGKRLERAGAPAMRIVSGNDEWTIGPGEPQATLTVERDDLFAGLAGRRSRSTMASWQWDGDRDAVIDHLPLFTPPPDA